MFPLTVIYINDKTEGSIGAALEALRPPVDLFVTQARPNLWPEIEGQCGQAFPQATSDGKGTPSSSVGVEGERL